MNKIICGDCIEEMKKLEENSIDSIVTDPPYGLEFMGKEWDKCTRNLMNPTSEADIKRKVEYGKNYSGRLSNLPDLSKNKPLEQQKWHEQWAKECLRVLKPGGHLLSFGGSRTYHRMTCAIEDAGFEIRDSIHYLYGSGFPKSLNIHKQVLKKFKYDVGYIVVYEQNGNTERTKEVSKYYLRPMSETNISETKHIKEKQGKVLQSGLSEQNISTKESQTTSNVRKEQPCMERWSYIQTSEGELQRCKVCEMSERIYLDGEERWICNGTPFGYGTKDWQTFKKGRSCPSYRPQSIEQQNKQSNVISKQYCTQEIRSYAEATKGYGTALKPACEIVCMARKPLSEKTVALNVLKHGTAGINIDGCRVSYENKGDEYHRKNTTQHHGIWNNCDGKLLRHSNNKGRFPANLILDEEAGRILDAQSGTIKSGKRIRHKNRPKSNFSSGINEIESEEGYADKGGASRFFKNIDYCENDNFYICSLCNIPYAKESNKEWKNINVNNVEKSLKTTQVTKENIVQKNVTENQKEKLAQIVKFVGNLCPKCTIDFVQNLVVISEVQKDVQSQEELIVIQDFTINYKKCILLQNLVNYVELMDNIDTTPTTKNLLKLFGFVQVAIRNYTQKIEKSEPKRFLYQAKASKSERNKGLDGFESKRGGSMEANTTDTMQLGGASLKGTPKEIQLTKNNHPTVKPIKLMRYLVRLVTPKGGIVLDPFLGSGTTAIAAKLEGFNYLGIEKEKDYVKIAEARIKAYEDRLTEWTK